MKTLILSNGQQVMVEDESNPFLIVIYCESFSDVDVLKNLITEKNMNGAVMDSVFISNVVFLNLYTAMVDNKVRIEFAFRELTESDILLERLSELEDAVNFLLMGGE